MTAGCDTESPKASGTVWTWSPPTPTTPAPSWWPASNPAGAPPACRHGYLCGLTAL